MSNLRYWPEIILLSKLIFSQYVSVIKTLLLILEGSTFKVNNHTSHFPSCYQHKTILSLCHSLGVVTVSLARAICSAFQEGLHTFTVSTSAPTCTLQQLRTGHCSFWQMCPQGRPLFWTSPTPVSRRW